MNFISQVSPRKAYHDLRGFLAQERPFKLLFLALALIPPVGLVVAIMIDANNKSAPPPPQIIYVESWPIDRSMAAIMAGREARRVARAARDAQVRENYKTLGRAVGMDVEEIVAEADAGRMADRAALKAAAPNVPFNANPSDPVSAPSSSAPSAR